MIAEAIEKIISISEPHMVYSGRLAYSDKKLQQIDQDMVADVLRVKSLKGFCEYIKQFADNDARDVTDYFVLVESPKCVSFISKLNIDRKREILIQAVPELPSFPYGTFIDTEKMIILLQSAFIEDIETDLAAVRRFVGTTTAGTIKEYSDDGVTQQATVRQGARGKVDDIVPSPCTLRPYRTFVEAVQPASKFIFRMEQGREQTVNAALIEADGGAWRLDAMRNVISYLEQELAETGVKIIG